MYTAAPAGLTLKMLRLKKTGIAAAEIPTPLFTAIIETPPD